MARCGCAGTCQCLVTAGEGVVIEGNGSKVFPYVISVPPAGGGSTATLPASLIHGVGATSVFAQSGVDAYGPITWSTESFDDIGIHDTAANTDRFTAPSAGRYKFTIQVSFETAGGGYRYVATRKGGVQPAQFTSAMPAAGFLTYVPVQLVAVYDLLAGEYIQVMGEINNVTTFSGINSEDRLTYVLVEKIS